MNEVLRLISGFIIGVLTCVVAILCRDRRTAHKDRAEDTGTDGQQSAAATAIATGRQAAATAAEAVTELENIINDIRHNPYNSSCGGGSE